MLQPVEVKPPYAGIVLDAEGEHVVIGWRFPTATENSRYIIQIQGKDEGWYEAKEGCEGRDNKVAAAGLCKVEVGALLKEPFRLLYNDPVHCRVILLDIDGN